MGFWGRTEADALREDRDFLRALLQDERHSAADRERALRAENAKLRLEMVALCNAGAAAQIESFRQSAKLPATAPKTASADPARHGDQRWAQDYEADGVVQPGRYTTEEDERIEKEARERERLALEDQGSGGLAQNMPDETPEAMPERPM